MQIIPVVHCFDNNYVIPASVSFLSMLKHASAKYFYKLYVLHNDISTDNQKKLASIVSSFKNASVNFVNYKENCENLFSSLTQQAKGHYSKEIFLKLFLPNLFPQYEYIVVTDVDVIFNGDISQSFCNFQKQSGKYLACVKTIMRPKSFLEDCYNNYKRQFSIKERDNLDSCGGYLIFNLREMRRDKIEDLFIQTLKKNLNRLLQPEQDIINLVIPKNKRFYLPLSSLVCTYAYELYKDLKFGEDIHYSGDEIKIALESPVQLHYATSTKPWNSPLSTKAELWFQYLTQTPFYYQWLCDFCRKNDIGKEITYSFAGLPIIKKRKNKCKLFNLLTLTKKCK